MLCAVVLMLQRRHSCCHELANTAKASGKAALAKRDRRYVQESAIVRPREQNLFSVHEANTTCWT